MNIICLAVPLLAASPFLQQFQDSDVDGLRFHRVHLTNGNFIDGQLLKYTAASVLLKLRAGEMTIRRDMIDRVEFVKMKDRFQAPIITTLPPPPKDAVKTDLKAEAKPDLKTPAEIQRRVDALLLKLKHAPGTEKSIPREELEALGDPAVPYLISKVPEMDLATADLVMQVLIVMETKAGNDVLIQQLRSEKPAIRSFACTVLGVQSDDMKRVYVRSMLRDQNDRVRATAITLLGSVQDAEWLDPVSDLCGDEARDVRTSALQISRQVAAKNSLEDKLVQILGKHLNSPTEGVRFDCVSALSALGVKESWSVVTPLLNDRSAAVRTAAASTLKTLAADECGPEVIEAISREQDPAPRVALLQLAIRLRLVKAAEHVVGWLEDSDEAIRKHAETGLKALTGENFGQDKEAWANWIKANKK